MRLLLVLLAMLGCNRGAVPGEEASNLLGAWSAQRGTVKASCDGDDPGTTFPVGPEERVALAISDDGAGAAVQFSYPVSCRVPATIVGATATLESDQSCESGGDTATFKQGGSLFTSDGVTLSGAFQIVWETVVSPQMTLTCTQNIDLTMSR